MDNSFSLRIRSYYDSLGRVEQKLATYLIENTKQASQLSIQQLAKQTDISTATISRFAKKVGYQSFQDLKFALNEGVLPKKEDFFLALKDSDSYKQMLDKTFYTNISALKATTSMITEQDLQLAMSLLLQANNLAFFGLGGSAIIALNAYHKFLRTPVQCLYHEDFHMQQMIATKMKATDCALVISHTGKNRDTLHLAKILKEHHVPFIVISSHANSPLTNLSNVSLISITEEIYYRPEAIASVASQISLIDSLFLIYAMNTREKSIKTIQEIRETIKKTRI